MSQSKKGRFTIKTAGFLFLLSAVFEIVFVKSEVPLFGAIRGGVAAIACHLFFAVLFGAIGFALWTAKSWAPKIVLGGTVVYTLDKAIFLLDRDFLESCLLERLEPYKGFLATATGYEDPLEVVSIQEISRAFDIIVLTIIGCWWAFALYLYLRRDYFRPNDRAAQTLATEEQTR